MKKEPAGKEPRGRQRHFVPIDEAPPFPLSERARETIALAWIGFCLYALLALATFAFAEIGDKIPRGDWKNLGGSFGYYLALGLTFVFGKASFVLIAFGLLHALLLFVRRELAGLVTKILGVLVFTVILAILVAGPAGDMVASANAPWGAGGRIGRVLSPKLYVALGGPGRLLFLGIGAIVAFMLATDWLFSSLLRRGAVQLGAAVERVRGDKLAVATAGAGAPAPAAATLAETAVELAGERRHGRSRGPAAAEPEAARAPEPEPEAEPLPPPITLERDFEAEAAAAAAEAAPAPAAEAAAGAAPAAPAPPRSAPRKFKIVRPKPKPPKAQQDLPFNPAYPFPPIELFREIALADDGAAREIIEKNAEAIEKKLASFRIEGKVVGVSPGPAVTQYEVRLAEGIKVSKIVAYEADLAAALMAVSVRVVAPIPGKDTIGVEVPNSERQIVVMRELLEQFGRAEHLAIPLFLGKDVAGKPIVEDLTRMPHLLIAGTTGSGKSVCINTILLSILMSRTPDRVRLILIDPKMVELQAYRKVPHLSCEVVTNMKKAPGVLQWAVEEMEKRYALCSAAGVNHIATYNKLGQQELEKRLQRPVDPKEANIPYQVLVIDELADLIVVAQNEVEESIQRLAQKSRAVGIHVILATQRPSADVITGVIKANLPCQIAFRVNRKIDSRVILDVSGAEKLLGHGDMLYMPPGSTGLVRAQGTFVSDEEIRRVVEFLLAQGQVPAFLPDLVQKETGGSRSPQDTDELYEKAVEVILGQQRGSATLLQRALAVGYTRATRLLELMEEDGLVGPFNGSRSRDVMMTLEEYQQRAAALAEELEHQAEAADSETPEAGAAPAAPAAAAEPDPEQESDAR